ncbi:hypothetical protein SteCoe_21262 [Stentor coeruleus]|uniref:RING-type domain-containing protein n=1 Tax=Stentor coeruleus TaxID=5963 RepID=A0A1R2BPU8_9CILI|nr:hypothetical protein SteCoe_21262 [Stentor coeruleus]
MNSELKCNLLSCNNKLEDNTYILSCGHTFCQSHGSKISGTCPLCSSTVIHLMSNFSQKSISSIRKVGMLGFNPKDIFETASMAIEFWNYQQDINNRQILKEVQQKVLILEKQNEELQTQNKAFAIEISKLKGLMNVNQGIIGIKNVEEKNIEDTPILFCPPSNRIIKEVDGFERNHRTSL